ncbi:MAG: FG-GAP repeat protein [Chitinispirillaceae bacterium]|nr:FG-GAP repeat protein [Chitinispirillaceae bacterium]
MLSANATRGTSFVLSVLCITAFSASSQQPVFRNWLTEAQKNITASEYFISRPSADGRRQSPNRAQNLRIRYDADGFSLEPRTVYGEKWNAALKITSIGKGAASLPVASVLDESRFVAAGEKLIVTHDGFDVEYVNTEQGMRQNFIVRSKPEGNGPLRIRLSISGTLRAIDKGDRDAVLSEWNDHLGAYRNRVWYKDLKAWDANGKSLPAAMEVRDGGRTIELAVNDSRAVYPVTVDPISTTAATTLECDQDSAYFGRSVSGAGDVNGDGYGDVIVGAYLYDNGESNEGAAFVFHGSASGLSTTPAVILQADQDSARFGRSVSGAGDINGDGYGDVIVGAAYYDHGESDEGAAFVFYGSASGIDTGSVDTLEANQAGAEFGTGVSGAGDVNGDGFSDVIVGAYLYDNGESDEGAAFVYYGSASGIDNDPGDTLEADQDSARFGYIVSGAGDVNGDGYSDVIAGARYYDSSETDEGAAFVFHGSASGLSDKPAARLISLTPQADAQFGACVSGAGDVNGDGYSDVVVGAYTFDNNAGAAFVFHGSASGVSAGIQLMSDQDSAYFGSGVSGAGDVNGDGYSDVVVGAHYYDHGQANEGAVFVFHGSTSGLDTNSVDTLESDQDGANFGLYLSGAGDVNGDGYSDIIVGAHNYDNDGTDEGAAFVFHGGASGVSASPGATLESDQASAHFGMAVSGAGDVNGDGYGDVIVGAPNYDHGESDEGAAFVYHGDAEGLSSTASTTLESNQASSHFGIAVSGAGDVNGDGYDDVIIGANWYDNGETDEGAAFVYHGDAAGLDTIPGALLESDQRAGHLGTSVSGAGDVNGDGYGDVIAGAGDYDNGETDEGAAFVYLGSAAGVSTAPHAALESDQASAHFGTSVSGAGDVNGDGYSDVIVGARDYDHGEDDEGAAFVYHGGTTGLDTNSADILEADQEGAAFGISVSGAGDVNGDGFSDVIAGAYWYDNGQTDEGAAFVFHGGASGLSASPSATLECDQASALFGISVSGVGDVNGDGYGDVIVGAYTYSHDEATEGATFVYHGGASGLSASPSAILEADQAAAHCGYSVSGAGDVNGDGYGDIITGARDYDNGETDAGAAFVYYGNNGAGRQAITRQYRTDLSTPLAAGGVSDIDGQVGLSLFAKSFAGRAKGRLVYEYVQNGEPFSGDSIDKSVAYTGRDFSFSDLGIAGKELKRLVTGITNLKAYRWRSRIQYDPATAYKGQVYGPWRYMPGYGTSSEGFRSGDMSTPSRVAPREYRIAAPATMAVKGRTIKYVLQKQSTVNILIYTMQGRTAFSREYREQQPGDYSIKLNGLPLAQAFYILAFKAGDYSMTKLIPLVE